MKSGPGYRLMLLQYSIVSRREWQLSCNENPLRCLETSPSGLFQLTSNIELQYSD
jgi:hypothetical protein